MDGSLATEGRAADLVGEVRDDLVGIHVRLRTAAGLPDDEGEVVVEVARLDLAGGLDDEGRELRVELAEVAIDVRRRPLHDAERADDRAPEALAADLEVLEAALRLRSPVPPLRHLDVAHAV